MANAWSAFYRKLAFLDVTLGPLADTEFLILNPDGKPVAGASVEPGEVVTPIGLSIYSPPRYVLRMLQAVTGEDGRVRLAGLEYGDFRCVQVATEALGIQRLRLPEPQDNLPRRREIHLRPAGRIFGRIVADRPEWQRDVKLSIATTSDPVGRRDIEGIAEVVTRADGLTGGRTSGSIAYMGRRPP